jgi:putative SOS response-associated peptidase YedK
MCNDYGNHIPYSDYLAAFSQTRIPVKWPNAIPNLQPRDDIWPTDRAPVIRRLEDGTNEFGEFRWGFPPGRPKGALTPVPSRSFAMIALSASRSKTSPNAVR